MLKGNLCNMSWLPYLSVGDMNALLGPRDREIAKQGVVQDFVNFLKRANVKVMDDPLQNFT